MKAKNNTSLNLQKIKTLLLDLSFAADWIIRKPKRNLWCAQW